MPANLFVPVFAETISGVQVFILGVLLIGVTFVVRWSARSTAKPSRDPLREVQDEFRQVENTYQAQLGRMEIRLHDFARELEGRMQTRIAVLDQLVIDARSEIERLEGLLNRIPPSTDPPPAPKESERRESIPLVAAIVAELPASVDSSRKPPHHIENEQSREICALADSGLSHELIAARTGQPLVRVRLVLRLHRPQRGAA